MKVKLSNEIKDLDGKVVPKNENNEPLTIQDVIVVCLQTPLKGDEEDDGATRIKKFEIMKNLHTSKAKEIDLDAASITLIKDRVLKVYPSPIIYGVICDAFGEKN